MKKNKRIFLLYKSLLFFCPEDYIFVPCSNVEGGRTHSLRAALSSLISGENPILSKNRAAAQRSSASFYDFCLKHPVLLLTIAAESSDDGGHK